MCIFCVRAGFEIAFYGNRLVLRSINIEIRLSLQLIGICVSDGVLPFEPDCYCPDSNENIDGPIDIGIQLTANVCIKQLTEMLEMVKMMALIGSGVQERLMSALDSLCEMTQDFTDSPFTAHHHREQILDFLEECRFEMSNLVNPQQEMSEHMRSEIIEVTVERLNRRLKDLRKQLQAVALDQIAAVFRTNDDQTILSSIKTCSVSGDIDMVEKYLEKFREHAAHLQEVCRLLHHVSLTDALHVYTGHSERNLRALAPLTLLAGRTLCIHPSSRIARENLEVFCDTWAANVNDLSRLVKDLDTAASNRTVAEKQAYMSLPRPGVSCLSRASPASTSLFTISNNSFCNSVVVNSACSDGSGLVVVSDKAESLKYREHFNGSDYSQTSLPICKDEVLYSTVNKCAKSHCVRMRTPHSDISASPKEGDKGSPKNHSAFVKYTKNSANEATRDQTQSFVFNQTIGSRVIMSQSTGQYTESSLIINSLEEEKEEEDHYRKVELIPRKAPLAVCDEIEEDEKVTCSGNKFENTVTFILEELQMEVDSLRQLQMKTTSTALTHKITSA